ncbi:MAG: proline dehydrogenase [Candidatus Eisenbacteria bacterium]|nr:proline dehydrogenase [Candidatus Eisenbacteria bacterium]
MPSAGSRRDAWGARRGHLGDAHGAVRARGEDRVALFDRLVIGVLPLVPKPVVGYFSKPYIAGETIADALRTAEALHEIGCGVTLDVLGENIREREQALAARDAYLRLLDGLATSPVPSNVSVKPTHFGLNFDVDFAVENIGAVVAKAAEQDGFVRVDMEDSPTTDRTLEAYRRLRERHANCGVVLQACLRRTVADAEALAASAANVRLCKGVYIEPYRISWRDPEIIRRNFVHILEILWRGGCYVGVATHDELLVWEAMRLAHEMKIAPDRFEFQMLLGVTERLRAVILESGYRMRVYVPYGRDWYAYSTRRLKENPQLAGTIALDILGLSQERKRR